MRILADSSSDRPKPRKIEIFAENETPDYKIMILNDQIRPKTSKKGSIKPSFDHFRPQNTTFYKK